MTQPRGEAPALASSASALQVGPVTRLGSTPGGYLAAVGGGKLFIGGDGLHSWDGVSFTQVLSPSPGHDVSYLEGVGDTVYLSGIVNSVTGERELFREGTYLKDINPSGSSNPGVFVRLGNFVFFGAEDGTGSGLWRTDGTAAGTTLVKQIRPGPYSASLSYTTAWNGALYFMARTDGAGAELWRSDGTTAGTVLLKDIAPGMSDGSPRDFAALEEPVQPPPPGKVYKLYFSAGSGLNRGLWETDGTSGGTQLVIDAVPGAPVKLDPMFLTGFNGKLYFNGEGSSGRELFVSDGTAAGTFQLKDIYAGSGSSNPLNFVPLDGFLYFIASDATGGRELWRTDGTAAGTVQVTDISVPGGNAFCGVSLTRAGKRLYFGAQDAAGCELWSSDGTTAGTLRVHDTRPGGASSYPTAVIAYESTVFYVADDGGGRALFALPYVEVAAFDSTLGVPACTGPAGGCQSGDLLERRNFTGRGQVPEANAPNTLDGCADGEQGRYMVDESIERIRIVNEYGQQLHRGGTAAIEVTAYIAFSAEDRVDVYLADDATNPVWTYVETLSPAADGLQVMETQTPITLPTGAQTRQAVRAVLRYGASSPPTSCVSTAVDPYVDHDDLVFEVL